MHAISVLDRKFLMKYLPRREATNFPPVNLPISITRRLPAAEEFATVALLFWMRGSCKYRRLKAEHTLRRLLLPLRHLAPQLHNSRNHFASEIFTAHSYILICMKMSCVQVLWPHERLVGCWVRLRFRGGWWSGKHREESPIFLVEFLVALIFSWSIFYQFQGLACYVFENTNCRLPQLKGFGLHFHIVTFSTPYHHIKVTWRAPVQYSASMRGFCAQSFRID